MSINQYETHTFRCIYSQCPDCIDFMHYDKEASSLSASPISSLGPVYMPLIWRMNGFIMDSESQWIHFRLLTNGSWIVVFIQFHTGAVAYPGEGCTGVEAIPPPPPAKRDRQCKHLSPESNVWVQIEREKGWYRCPSPTPIREPDLFLQSFSL